MDLVLINDTDSIGACLTHLISVLVLLKTIDLATFKKLYSYNAYRLRFIPADARSCRSMEERKRGARITSYGTYA